MKAAAGRLLHLATDARRGYTSSPNSRAQDGKKQHRQTFDDRRWTKIRILM
jgi:hypothetical protein